jgi:ComF family protein
MIAIFNCFLCRSTSRQQSFICDSCYAALPWNYNCCRICALPLPSLATSRDSCGKCLGGGVAISAAFTYAEPVSSWLKLLKHNSCLEFADFFASCIFDYLLMQEGFMSADLIIPVPLHRQRLKSRGYNQALQIAKCLSSLLDIPYDVQSCIRTKSGLSQQKSNYQQRIINMSNAFTSLQDLTGKRVLLIDDVATTTSTIAALSSCIIAANALSVRACVVARVS